MEIIILQKSILIGNCCITSENKKKQLQINFNITDNSLAFFVEVLFATAITVKTALHMLTCTRAHK